MPICIPESIYRQCLHLGLNPDDAHDCVAEVCLRYHKRTGAFPHDEETPDLRLLRLLTLNVVREHQRDAATTPATGAGLPRPATATARQRAHADGAGDCPRGLRAVSRSVA
jgi:DNA-directed RNA polymerase specialized sigma24 family protein